MKQIMVILMSILVMLTFSGCVTDKAYSVAKIAYSGGEIVVKELDLNKNGKFNKIDKVAKTYDKTRTVVKKEYEVIKEQEIKKKE